MPVVESIGDSDGGILGTVAVGVSDEGALPVVVELAVSDRNAGAAVGNIEQTIVAV